MLKMFTSRAMQEEPHCNSETTPVVHVCYIHHLQVCGLSYVFYVTFWTQLLRGKQY
jgi:hypothetical protein